MPKTIVLTMTAAFLLLNAQAQTVIDGPGVKVNLNGAQVLHRTPLTYPAEAAAKGVEGTVVIEARLDANGEVTDDTVLSGPDELRKSAQQTVLNWHFDKTAGLSPRVVNIDFIKPSSASGAPLTVRSTDPLAVRAVAMPGGTIGQIDVTGLSDTATASLLAQLPIHTGDPFTSDTLPRTRQATREFDTHLVVGLNRSASGANVITIRPEGVVQAVVPAQNPTPLAPNLTVPPGAALIASNVEASNLINAVKPVYPPLAKMARQQGTVKFQATIGKAGNVDDLLLISGPPLLVQSAMDAVKKWTYQPMVLNGAPVQVVTTIDVNFTLAQ